MCFEKVSTHKHRIIHGSLVCKVHTNSAFESGIGAFDAKTSIRAQLRFGFDAPIFHIGNRNR
jgi:hypothetical protein